MPKATLEHVNVTVSDPDKTAALLCHLFDWRVRWKGAAKMGGYTVHVGDDTQYLAVYTLDREDSAKAGPREALAGLNHIGIEVDDLDATETRILNAGFKTFSHGDYEPGRRFYFNDDNGIEFEIVNYAKPSK